MMKAVVFDRDGVLIDSEKFHLNSMKRAFSEKGIVLSEEDTGCIIGRSPIDYLQKFEKKYNMPHKDIDEIHSSSIKFYYEEFDTKGEIMHGVEELLSKLKKNNIKIVLATSSSKQGIDHFFRTFGLKDYFDFVLGRDDVKKRKPDPEIYLKAKQKLGFECNEIVVIEDSEVGVTAAKSAGLLCIALKNEYTSHERSKADYVVDSIPEAEKIIIKLLEK